MKYLIDGYNLLHAMGVMRDQMGRKGLESARRRLLDLLRASYADDEIDGITVVFDAANAPHDSSEEVDYRGILVRFAVKEKQADEVIENLIRRSSMPSQLTVVSDDHRIQKAARRGHCKSAGCQEYLEWLDRHRRKRREPPTDEPTAKPKSTTSEETAHWLREFGHLDKDPDMKEAFNPFDFDFEEEN